SRLCPSPAEPNPQNQVPLRVGAPLVPALLFSTKSTYRNPCNTELTLLLQTGYLARIALRRVNLRTFRGVLRNRSVRVSFQADLALNSNGGMNAIIFGVYAG